LALEPGLSVFQFCEVGGRAIISGGLSQIWLKFREKIGIFFSNPTIYWRHSRTYGLNMAIYGFFPPKRIFWTGHHPPPFFLVAKWQKFPTKKH
jgi:hypothetical protein